MWIPRDMSNSFGLCVSELKLSVLPASFFRVRSTLNVNITQTLHGTGIFTYIGVISEGNVGKYAIHGVFG